MPLIGVVTKYDQPNSIKFTIKGNKISYIGENGIWTHFVFNKFIKFDNIFNFKVKITKTVNKYIMIGIIDYEKQKNQRSSYSSNNAICYCGWNNGYIYPDNQNVGGGGFSQG
jgi:hypothetical protein